nr:MAG TPA: hypothetical protein [Caudoviricetes sp.]
MTNQLNHAPPRRSRGHFLPPGSCTRSVRYAT